MDAIAEFPPQTRSDTAPADATLTFSAWTKAAVECLREYWPATDARQLQGIAVELFSDPVSGVLPPREAVEQWMAYLAAGTTPRRARLR